MRNNKIKWHPVIRSHMDELNIRVTPRLLKRAQVIMNTIAIAMQERGYEIDSDTTIHVKGAKVKLYIYEKCAKVKRELTRQEEQFRRSYSDRCPVPLDALPCGKLVFMLIDCYSLKNTWQDGVKKKLEDHIDSIKLNILKCARYIKQLERDRIKHEQEYRIEEAANFEKELHITTLNECVAISNKKKRIQTCLEEMKKTGIDRFGTIDKDSELGKFLEWGQQYIDNIDLFAPVDEMKEERAYFDEIKLIKERFYKNT